MDEGTIDRFRCVITGACVGLTFLAHTAPAVMLAGLACVLFARNIKAIAQIGGTALIIAAPFLFSIGLHYRLHILNWAPIRWQYLPLSLAQLPSTLRMNGFLVAAAIAGLVLLPERRVLIAWVALAFGLMLYNLRGPAFIPAFHFWLYTTAALMVLAGGAVARLVRRPALVVVLNVIALLIAWPSYAGRADFREGRAQSLGRDPDLARAADFLRRTVPPNEAVLGDDAAVNQVIAPAGRRTVAAQSLFSNPYVALEPRAADRRRMFDAIDAHDRARLAALEQRYGVSTVVSVNPEWCAAAARTLELAYRFGDVCVLR